MLTLDVWNPFLTCVLFRFRCPHNQLIRIGVTLLVIGDTYARGLVMVELTRVLFVQLDFPTPLNKSMH